MFKEFRLYNGSLEELRTRKKLITTLNAHSYNTQKTDRAFKEALKSSDVLLPDGVSMVWASNLLNGEKIRKIAGHDLFYYEMKRVSEINGTVFFLGSSDKTLVLIKERARNEFPNVTVYTYSPPFKPSFTNEDNEAMLEAINTVKPDVLFVGMTAPKQEKWAFENFSKIDAQHICCIGAVFDFYAGTVKRAPNWMINAGMEWFYRLAKEPRRMWRRYLVGNVIFASTILKQKYFMTQHKKAIKELRLDEVMEERKG